ncbi:MAG: McrB family protein, partial [Nostoc sp.]
FAGEGLINILQQLNQAIADKNYEIGISFFLTDNLREDIEDIWRMEIEPYLEEYFFNELQKVDKFRWDEIKNKLWI